MFYLTLLGTTTPGQSEHGSNGNEGVLHIPQYVRARTSPSDCFMSYLEHSLRGGFLPLCRDAVGIVYCSSGAGWRLLVFNDLTWTGTASVYV